MSHQVTITRTTTTTSTSAVIVNTGYLKTWPGILKLVQLILGAICVGIVSAYLQDGGNYFAMYVFEFFFLLVTVTFLINTFCLLLACMISLSAGTVISKTIYEVIYHGIAFILYLAASLTLLIQVINRHNRSRYYYGNYEAYLAAAIIGLVNTFLYLLSAVFAYRSYSFV